MGYWHVFNIYFVLSGTLLVKKDSGQSRQVIIEVPMVSLSSTIALTKSHSTTSSSGYRKSIAMRAKTSTNYWLGTSVI